MRVVQHPSNNKVLGAPPGWDQLEMPVNAIPLTQVESSGKTFLISYWKPTPEEIAQLRQGAFVTVWIHGVNQPIMAVSVNV